MKAKLLIALMYSNKDIYNNAISLLIKRFGEIDRESLEYKFNFTNYYEKEMGSNLLKRFVTFKELIDAEELKKIKLFTHKIEEKFSMNNKRLINIDPGYITKTQLVLASFKEKPRKIYLGKGVYADLILLFKKDGCITFKWTFPDYKLKENQEFFLEVRKNILTKNL